MKDTIYRQDAIDVCLRVRELRAYDEIEEIKALPSAEPNLQPTCNQLATDCISRQGAIDAICTWDKFGVDERGRLVRWYEGLEPYVHLRDVVFAIEKLPSAESEWNNHTVACLLADMFDDPCACNYCGIDEWLPEKCEVIDSCPNPVGVACWDQFLTHRKERG